MNELTQVDKELLRGGLLEYLAPRFRLPFSAEQLAANLVNRGVVDFALTPNDVLLALTILRDKGWVTVVRDDTGAIEYYQVTGPGIVEQERRSGLRIR